MAMASRARAQALPLCGRLLRLLPRQRRAEHAGGGLQESELLALEGARFSRARDEHPVRPLAATQEQGRPARDALVVEEVGLHPQIRGEVEGHHRPGREQRQGAPRLGPALDPGPQRRGGEPDAGAHHETVAGRRELEDGNGLEPQRLAHDRRRRVEQRLGHFGGHGGAPEPGRRGLTAGPLASLGESSRQLVAAGRERWFEGAALERVPPRAAHLIPPVQRAHDTRLALLAP
jgi:hypothetical protein